MVSPKLLPIVTGQIKVRANDWVVEGKEVEHKFTVSVSGGYKVFVENVTNTTVDVTDGTYRVY